MVIHNFFSVTDLEGMKGFIFRELTYVMSIKGDNQWPKLPV